MGFWGRIFAWRQPRPEPQSPEPPPNLAAIIHELLVEKVKAEADATRANAEFQLRLLREKEELRAVRREAARLRNKTYPRDSKGRIRRPSDAPPPCPICHGALSFSEAELAEHRAHKNGNGNAQRV